MQLGRTSVTLRTKTVVILMGILIAMGGLNTFVLLQYFSRHYRDSLQGKAIATGESFLKVLQNTLSLGLSLDQLEGINEQAKKIVEQHRDIGYVLVADRTGKILYHSAPGEVGKRAIEAGSTQASSAEGHSIQLVRIGPEEYYNVILPLSTSVKESQGVVHLGLKAQAIQFKIRTLVFFSSVMALLSILTAGSLQAFFLLRNSIQEGLP